MFNVPYDPKVTTPTAVRLTVAELLDRWYPETNRPVLVPVAMSDWERIVVSARCLSERDAPDGVP